MRGGANYKHWAETARNPWITDCKIGTGQRPRSCCWPKEKHTLGTRLASGTGDESEVGADDVRARSFRAPHVFPVQRWALKSHFSNPSRHSSVDERPEKSSLSKWYCTEALINLKTSEFYHPITIAGSIESTPNHSQFPTKMFFSHRGFIEGRFGTFLKNAISIHTYIHIFYLLSN